MPPFIPRKRPASAATQDQIETAPSAKVCRRSRPTNRASPFPTRTSTSKGPTSKGSQRTSENTSNEPASSLSLGGVDSDDFEDVVPAAEVSAPRKDGREEDEEENETDWEDAMADEPKEQRFSKALENGNLELNLSSAIASSDFDPRAAIASKKGPSKIERRIRVQTHCMHVQCLLFHNAIRNRWACSKKVQKILVDQVPPGVLKEIEKWQKASGIKSETPSLKAANPERNRSSNREEMSKRAERNNRDWGAPSTRLDQGKPDLSHGDPLITLLKILAAYWKKRFAVTAPGLRKQGYTSAAERQGRIKSFQKGQLDPKTHGERIASLEEFCEYAVQCRGSRDVGAQLFAALLRGIGIEGRIVASLQPSGFGWTKSEQATSRFVEQMNGDLSHSFSGRETESDAESISKNCGDDTRHKKKKRQLPGDALQSAPSRRGAMIHASNQADSSDSDDASVVDVTPHQKLLRRQKFDQDLHFPNYWVEAISPITSKVIPVSPLVLQHAVASTPEILSTFEPRGAKADQAKQVIAYVIAYSPDGSAKDVTTRYLKKQMWPGKTKGVRLPPERIAAYDKRGKIKGYEDYDWFRNVMRGYVRTEKMRTHVDDIEEASDLLPRQAEKKERNEDVDTLQSLKGSADFVLERFLRREEALRANAQPVRIFSSGKGDKLKQEHVYSRKDVERCLSAESWHKEGRQVKQGEAPLKFVPIRAVTLTRKREVEDMQRQTGEKPTQGLYSWDQTEYIIPPPIEDGVIPKNSYGNIDCFVPSMVPVGAVHLPMRGTVRICKKLGIDYAEAVTGFEFGSKLAVPVVQGVVVAEEHGKAVREGWEEFAEQQRIKEEGKLQAAILATWKKMLMGLRIRERVNETYGEYVNPRIDDDHERRAGYGSAQKARYISDLKNIESETEGGGFLPENASPPRPDSSQQISIEECKPSITGRQQKPTPKQKASSAQQQDQSPLSQSSLSSLSSSAATSKKNSINQDRYVVLSDDDDDDDDNDNEEAEENDDSSDLSDLSDLSSVG